MDEKLRLRPPRLEDEEAVRVAADELIKDGFVFQHDLAHGWSWPDVVTRVERQRQGQDLDPGWVPTTFLLATVAGEVVGRSSIRHALNDFLLALGGHIGYAVRPAYRRRGYATEILRESVIVARSLGIDRVLVTCDEDNRGSAAVIRLCGGILENVVDDPAEGRRKKRYWID